MLDADIVVVTQGPGNLGTGTRWGFSGVAAGEAVNAVAALGGRPVGPLRISAADLARRATGVSHHSLTAYGRVALLAADLAVPDLPGDFGGQVRALGRAARAPGTAWSTDPLHGLDAALARSPCRFRRWAAAGDRTAPTSLAAALPAGRHAARLLLD